MTANGPSSGPTEDSLGRCVSCKERAPFHRPFCPLLSVSLPEKVGGPYSDDRAALRREIMRLRRQAAGSSSTTTGSAACRTWSVTVSWTSGCLRVTLAKSDSTSRPARSGSGTDGGRTSDSSKSSTGAGSITGTDPDAERLQIADRLLPILTNLMAIGRISKNDVRRISNAIWTRETP